MNACHAKVPGYEILRTEVGSTLHGLEDGSSDRDLMGITVEPANVVFGLAVLEQYEWRTALGGARSGPEDVDLIVYGLKKWMSLATKGNPSVIMPLFAPEPIESITPIGRELQELAPAIVSLRCRKTFLEYLGGQRRRVCEVRSDRRTKWASHMVRLGFQAEELLTTGRLTLPMPADQASMCRAIKRGDVPVAEALEVAWELERRVERIEDSPLPLIPDMERIEAWMHSVYLRVLGDTDMHQEKT